MSNSDAFSTPRALLVYVVKKAKDLGSRIIVTFRAENVIRVREF